MIGRTGRFRRSDRLVDARDFRRVMRRGRRRATDELVVFSLRRDRSGAARPEGAAYSPQDSSGLFPTGSRIGITASRKVGNAVVRNRFKRRVREWFRRHRDGIPEPRDLVVIARRSGAELGAAELARHLDRMVGVSRPLDG